MRRYVAARYARRPRAVIVVAMSGEETAITSVSSPATARTLVTDLRALGLTTGVTVIVHSSLSRLGWVAGGARAVVDALIETIGESGTLVMPTHASGLSEPSHWQHPPVPEDWWQIIRDETPAFDPQRTPTRKMGAIVECFRHYPGVQRSGHPQVSFAALGANASAVTAGHTMENPLGEASPLARLYDLDAHILLLGVGHTNNTALHLAEYRAEYSGKQWTQQGAPVAVNGERRWVTFDEIEGDDADFAEIGIAFATAGGEQTGQVGIGSTRLMTIRSLVDFATAWMTEHRA